MSFCLVLPPALTGAEAHGVVVPARGGCPRCWEQQYGQGPSESEHGGSVFSRQRQRDRPLTTSLEAAPRTQQCAR
ncbi:hypothetical protein C8Q76DRAFT_703255 [Earliella scabrosa]|nr:hypothetical protein C8Q76DRAFT_703255 [Earliella scabrosa]